MKPSPKPGVPASNYIPLTIILEAFSDTKYLVKNRDSNRIFQQEKNRHNDCNLNTRYLG